MSQTKLSKRKLIKEIGYANAVSHAHARIAKMCACELRLVDRENSIFNPESTIITAANLKVVDEMLESGQYEKDRAVLKASKSPDAF